MKKPAYVLGLNFVYHEVSACLLKDGKLLAAVEEERFSRIKRGKKCLIDNPDVLPVQSIEYCLSIAGISLREVDYIGLSFMPEDRLRQNIGVDEYLTKGDWGTATGEKLFYKKLQKVPGMISKLAGRDMMKKITWVPHHICHASSAYFVSPFKESAVLTIDGIGEFSSAWIGYGKNNAITNLYEISYPNSIGFLWEKMSKYIGFTEYDSSKVMGLAAYGNSKRFYTTFQKIVTLTPEGTFTVDTDVMRFRVEDYSRLEKIFGVKRIHSPKDIRKEQKDIAAALQKITDDVVIHVAKYLKKKTGSDNICLAGGVALNCVCNNVLMKSGLFKNIYVQPAANDAGTALGVAYYLWNQVLGHKRSFVMDHVYWGPGYSDASIRSALDKSKASYHKSANIAKELAGKIAEGNIAGWFQGRSEWGPRALGNRSLLADPRRKNMKRILNERIKKREGFRPFAPSVLKEDAAGWFVIPKKSQSISTEFMEINFDIQKSKQKRIPAVTHIDGTGRVQLVNKKTNPLYHKLISEFRRLTGVPILLNTSFNDNEPIVCSPEDALKTFLRTKMDYLAIGPYLVSKKAK